jgi:hypothetical protein
MKCPRTRENFIMMSFVICIVCGLDDWGLILNRDRKGMFFSLCHHIKTSSGAQPGSYPVVAMGLFPWVLARACN